MDFFLGRGLRWARRWPCCGCTPWPGVCVVWEAGCSLEPSRRHRNALGTRHQHHWTHWTTCPDLSCAFLLLNFKLIADCWLCIHRTRSCDELGVIGACGLSQRSMIFWSTAVHWIAANHNTWKEELDGFKKHSKVGWKKHMLRYESRAFDPQRSHSSFHFFRFHAWP